MLTVAINFAFIFYRIICYNIKSSKLRKNYAILFLNRGRKIHPGMVNGKN